MTVAPSGAGNSVIGAFPPAGSSDIKVLIMATHNITFCSRNYSLTRSGKPSIADKLEKVFQMADNVDARCVYMLGAGQRRRHVLAVR
jgi:hypothetical protein